MDHNLLRANIDYFFMSCIVGDIGKTTRAIKQIAKNIDVDHIIHGQFTIMEQDSSIKIIAFLANTKTHESRPLMKEKYPLANLSDIPTFINEKISSYVKTNFQLKADIK